MSKFFGNREVLSGLMFILFGAFFFLVAGDYSMGTAARMGPAFFPKILGGILMVMGAAILLVGLAEHKRGDNNAVAWQLKPMLAICLSIGVFGFALTTLGLLAAIILLVIISGAVAHDVEWKSLIIVALIMAIGCVAVFVYGLKLQIPVFPWSK